MLALTRGERERFTCGAYSLDRNMLKAHFDEENGIAVTVARGLASVEVFDAYVPDLMTLMARSRARHGRSLHLVDATDNPVQAQSAFAHMASVAEGTARPGDLCAVVFRSALARMQLARIGAEVARQVFDDVDEAQSWLLAQSAALAEAA